MFWTEDISENSPNINSKMVDILFKIKCAQLPLNHIDILSDFIELKIPWIKSEPNCGIHQIHIAEEGNGWTRPTDDTNYKLHPSNRTRLIIRISEPCIPLASELTGQTVDIKSHILEIGKFTIRTLKPLDTLYSRYVISPETHSEDAFLHYIAHELTALSLPTRKLLCGKNHFLKLGNKTIHTRSIMISDLDPEQSLILQETGIGEGRLYGCGLFIPHKGIKSLTSNTFSPTMSK